MSKPGSDYKAFNSKLAYRSLAQRSCEYSLRIKTQSCHNLPEKTNGLLQLKTSTRFQLGKFGYGNGWHWMLYLNDKKYKKDTTLTSQFNR